MTNNTAGSTRFTVLKWLMVVAGIVLSARIVQIQIIQHDKYEELANSRWSKVVSIEAERGNLYDRDGRPLAMSITTWRIGVACSLVESPAALATVLAEAMGCEANAMEQKIRRAGCGHIVLGKDVVLSEQGKKSLRKEKAVTMENLHSRLYPYDGVGASVIGFFRPDAGGAVSTGLENSLADYLAGKQGHAREVTMARAGATMGKIVTEKAVHGLNLKLSLDIELQSICEQRLRESIAECGVTHGGAVLIMDPETGDVLAAASAPLMDTRDKRHSDSGVWINRNFTGLYEPGSVFKIFSAASLLRNGAVDTSTVFNCDDGAGGTLIRNSDSHSYGDLSLMDAIAKSSNIYFAQAVGNLSKRELYRDLLDFGFGQRTSFPYPGQPAGRLSKPEHWSGRSKPTIAIGQEISVTPLQMTMAMCSVANGGRLMAPRLITEVSDAAGHTVEKIAPLMLREVMADPLAEVLRLAMGRVVETGTGKAAGLEWVSTGGKTGTAQKYKGGPGYEPGAYIASFAGMVPLQNPRLVILTMLDEPVRSHHYASASAAPLFKRIVQDIRSNTDWLTDVPGAHLANLEVQPTHGLVEVPDVQYLGLTNAAQRLEHAGLQMVDGLIEGLVVEQVPAAGTLCTPGSLVHLTVAGNENVETPKTALVPDFHGLSVREVRATAARLGIPVALEGVGYVMEQWPAKGTSLSAGPVKVQLKGSW